MREPFPNRATFFDFGRAAVAIYPFFRRAVFFSKPIIPKIIISLNFIIKKTKQMEIKNSKEEIIFRTDKDTIANAVEEAVKNGANLRDANLRVADLYGADLRYADLYGADLRDADLRGADLRYADLRGADLYGADLRDANLRDANLRYANLYGAENIPFIPLACPSDGEFTAWKKVDGKLIELRIPAEAKRSSATTNKCKCDKAFVVSIVDIKTGDELAEIVNNNYTDTTYRVGEMVYPDSFDENRWKECSNGIHFFIDKDSAINY